jgi:hypothetical protein
MKAHQAAAMADDVSPQRPLPDCLTRFLSDPAPQSWPLPGRPTPSPKTGDARPAAPNRAMPIFLAWALAYNVLGFAIIVMLWRSMG